MEGNEQIGQGEQCLFPNQELLPWASAELAALKGHWGGPGDRAVVQAMTEVQTVWPRVPLGVLHALGILHTYEDWFMSHVAQSSWSSLCPRRCHKSLNRPDHQLQHPEVLEETWLIEIFLILGEVTSVGDLDSLKHCKYRIQFLQGFLFWTTKYTDEEGTTEAQISS